METLKLDFINNSKEWMKNQPLIDNITINDEKVLWDLNPKGGLVAPYKGGMVIIAHGATFIKSGVSIEVKVVFAGLADHDNDVFQGKYNVVVPVVESVAVIDVVESVTEVNVAASEPKAINVVIERSCGKCGAPTRLLKTTMTEQEYLARPHGPELLNFTPDEALRHFGVVAPDYVVYDDAYTCQECR